MTTFKGQTCFAWVAPTETTFNPSVHNRYDENVFAWERHLREGRIPVLVAEIKASSHGLLNATRKQFCWLSVYAADGTTLVPVFFGRIVGVPKALNDNRIQVRFLAQRPGWETARQQVAETLKVAPYWDVAFVAPSRRFTADAVLEARSARWCWDPVSGAVTASDLLGGTALDLTGKCFRDSLKITSGAAPAALVILTATVTWKQVATGADAEWVNTQVRDAFQAQDGSNTVASFAPNLARQWPKLSGFGGSSGYSVLASSCEVIGVTPSAGVQAGPPVDAATVDAATAGEVVLAPELADGGITVNPPIYTYATTLSLAWRFLQQRREVLTMVMESDIQPVAFDQNYTGSSVTTVVLATGAVSLTVAAGKGWSAGQYVMIVDAGNPWNFLYGTVSSYAGTTLGVNVTTAVGVNPSGVWVISLSVAAAAVAAVTSGTSSTPAQPYYGPKILTTQSGQGWLQGQIVTATSLSKPGLFMQGPILSYVGNILSFQAVRVYNTTPMALTVDWTFTVTEAQGFGGGAVSIHLHAQDVVKDGLIPASYDSYFATAAGTASMGYLSQVARARLAASCRAVRVEVETDLFTGLSVDLTKVVTIADPRLPGGTVSGKVVAAVLVRRPGRSLCRVSLACPVGNGNTLTPAGGTPEYVSAAYVAGGYQVSSGAEVATSADVNWTLPVVNVYTPLALARASLNPVQGITITNGPNAQQTAMQAIQYPVTLDPTRILDQIPTRIALNLVSLIPDSDATTYVTVPVAKPWAAPMGVDLGA
ncbi:MAG: hypothetical protein HQL37_01700 [Alphaproteobacteria bacterium]|nr:hypothetical protein [Alphaproteobacteria bacterium]